MIITQKALPVNVASPDAYDKGWISFGDFWGTGAIACAKKKFRSFEDARMFARALNLKSSTEWRKYRKGKLVDKGKKPNDIPTVPDVSYRNKGWKGWGDFLGTGNMAYSKIKRYSFEEAREYAQTLKLRSSNEWKKYSKGELPDKRKRPKDIPASPNSTDKRKGWVSWGDWLGTGRNRKTSAK